MVILGVGRYSESGNTLGRCYRVSGNIVRGIYRGSILLVG